jgi:hypothetical protein
MKRILRFLNPRPNAGALRSNVRTRLHSAMIEFDHQAPGPLGNLSGGPGRRIPTRQHIRD